VADVIRKAGTRFIERNRASLTWAQVKVLNAIARCRTAALGGHRDQCAHCSYQAISYNSCLMGSLSLWGVRRRNRRWIDFFDRIGRAATHHNLKGVCYVGAAISWPMLNKESPC
jgi:hypothetical protein